MRVCLCMCLWMCVLGLFILSCWPGLTRFESAFQPSWTRIFISIQTRLTYPHFLESVVTFAASVFSSHSAAGKRGC